MEVPEYYSNTSMNLTILPNGGCKDTTIFSFFYASLLIFSKLHKLHGLCHWIIDNNKMRKRSSTKIGVAPLLYL